MDVMYQAMDQMLRGTEMPRAERPNRGQQNKQGKKDDDFGKMVQDRKAAREAGKAPQKQEKSADQVEEQPGVEEQGMMAAMVMQIQLPAEEAPVIMEEQQLDPVSLEPLRAAAEQTANLGPQLNVVREDAPELAPEQQTVQEAPREMNTQRFAPVERRPEIVLQEEEAPEEAPVEAPVFDTTDAVPVKVADPAPAPLPLEAEDAPEQLAAVIENFLTEENGDSRIELTLTPAELGKISVEITHSSDGALHIALRASTDRAASLLESHSGGLQQLLGNASRPSVEVEVRYSGEAERQLFNPNDANGQQQQQQQQQQRQNQRQEERNSFDFIQQLRLGLVGPSGTRES